MGIVPIQAEIRISNRIGKSRKLFEATYSKEEPFQRNHFGRALLFFLRPFIFSMQQKIEIIKKDLPKNPSTGMIDIRWQAKRTTVKSIHGC